MRFSGGGGNMWDRLMMWFCVLLMLMFEMKGRLWIFLCMVWEYLGVLMCLCSWVLLLMLVVLMLDWMLFSISWVEEMVWVVFLVSIVDSVVRLLC